MGTVTVAIAYVYCHRHIKSRSFADDVIYRLHKCACNRIIASISSCQLHKDYVALGSAANVAASRSPAVTCGNSKNMGSVA